MTAVLTLTAEIARRLKGKCAFLGQEVIANDGQIHSDCATCFAQCGDFKDLGLADAGIAITKDWSGLNLRWNCPGCGIQVYAETNTFNAISDAKRIFGDPLCVRCRGFA